VGQGDAALVELPDGARLLVDTGPPRAARHLVAWLRERRVQRLDALVLSHPHPDHVGALDAVLDAFEVRAIGDNGQADASASENSVAESLARARARGIPVLTPAQLCRAPLRHGEARVVLLHPCPSLDEDAGE